MFYEEKGKYEIITVARPVFTAILPNINRQTFKKDGHVSRMINEYSNFIQLYQNM